MKKPELCPVCQSKMKMEDKVWICSACGFEIVLKKPKKMNYRTKRNLEEK